MTSPRSSPMRTIDGEPIPVLEKMGYYVIIATAGHDTTAAAMAGGVQALAENPDQLEFLKRNPEQIAERGRGDDPLDRAGEALHADRPVGRPDRRHADRQG